MRPFFRLSLWLAAGLLFCCRAFAFEVGWQPFNVTGAAPVTAALYYPTQAAPRETAMGPFTVRAAIRAAPEERLKGLIVLSHGLAGTELGHGRLAEALARDGYLVAAIRHAGDNWQDASLMQRGAAAYFTERPRQVSQLIDALLADPRWKDRIASDAQGPRIGALGHSAGGYTVLALAGGQADLSQSARHCERERSADPVFCGIGKDAAPSTSPLLPSLRDARVRAVVLMAPVGVPFTASSLAAIRVPVQIHVAMQDRFLVPRFHGEWLAQQMPQAVLHRVPNASHFAFMDKPGMPIATPGGDVQEDPPGFDRAAFLAQLGPEVAAFFDKAWPAP
ncbi:MAG: dienelactone hydrolase [Pseudomonadota bacterium]